MEQGAKRAAPSGYAVWGSLLVGGVLASVAAPKLLSVGRKAARRAVGVTYRDQPSANGPATVDPARGRPA